MRAPPLFLGVSLCALAACASAPEPATPAQPGACPGRVEAAEGLREIEDGGLLQQALGAPGKGNLCAGKVFEATGPVTVYRVWSKSKPHTRLGRWWSFSAPRGPASAYRVANAICAEWSDLDVVTECRLKVGARVVIGPGQSATCEKVSYPPSATNQVFIPNDTRDPAHQQLFVDGCSPDAAWP